MKTRRTVRLSPVWCTPEEAEAIRAAAKAAGCATIARFLRERALEKRALEKPEKEDTP
jgi:hypothetical protein